MYANTNLTKEEQKKMAKYFPGGPWKTPAKLKAEIEASKKK